MVKKILVLATALFVMLTSCAKQDVTVPPAEDHPEQEVVLDETQKQEPAEEGLNICLLTNADVHDGTYFENCYEGILQFIEQYPASTVKNVVDTPENMPETLAKIAGDYDVFVLPGFAFTHVGDSVKAHPETKFIVLDTLVYDSLGNKVSADNLYTMRFRDEECGLYGGITAALQSKTGKVAAVIGIPVDSNLDYQYGFMAGVEYANAHYGTEATCITLEEYAFTDETGKTYPGNFIGNFVNVEDGKKVGKALIDQGVDMLFVAAGNAGTGVFEAAKEADGVYGIGSDSDLYEHGQKGEENIILTSGYKAMDRNILRQLNEIQTGLFVGQDDVLDAGNHSTGFVCKEGRHGLTEDTLAKLNEVQELLQNGTVVAPSAVNGYTYDNFPGLQK